MPPLTGPLRQQLIDALIDAFPDPDFLAHVVSIRFNRNLAAIALGPNFEVIVFRLVQRAEAEGWVDGLVDGARQSNPGNERLLAVAQAWQLATVGPPHADLERIIHDEQGFLDPAKWRSLQGSIEARVCRIEIPLGTPIGTGFLVNSDVVMTNHHVVQPVIDGTVSPTEVVLRFDYKRSAEGNTVNSGIEFRLADDAARWLIDASPPSPIDTQPEPKAGVPQTDQLDYALLRLQDAPGATTIGAAGDFRDAKRGWIAVSAPAAAPKQGAPLFIMQHPAGQPLKLAFSGNGIIGVNANSTRVRYDVNTEAGSSGAPCFDLNWSLVAIHHSGDPNFAQPTYNEGIPIGAIVALMNQRGVAGVLGPAT